MSDECTGNVIRMTTVENVNTDSRPGRVVKVHLTRCTACSGTAHVVHDDGNGTVREWAGLEIPIDYATDDGWAAYWAAEESSHKTPTRVTEPEPVDVEPFRTPEPGDPEWDDYVAAMEEDAAADALADAEAERAFAESLERRAESGTWFGSDPVGAEHW